MSRQKRKKRESRRSNSQYDGISTTRASQTDKARLSYDLNYDLYYEYEPKPTLDSIERSTESPITQKSSPALRLESTTDWWKWPTTDVPERFRTNTIYYPTEQTVQSETTRTQVTRSQTTRFSTFRRTLATQKSSITLASTTDRKLPTTRISTTTQKSSTTQRTTRQQSTQQETISSIAHDRILRIQPGTILMMNSDYLKQKYIRPQLATTFHRALLADYFGLSEIEMKQIGMSVVAWGFSYQVKDKAIRSKGHNGAQKYFCDFKFRSATFNAGYVGAEINMDITELDG